MNFLLTEHEGCTGEFGPSRGSTDRAQCGQGPILSSAAQASELRKYYMALGPNLFILNLPAFATKDTRLMEMVRTAKYGPSNNQSEPSDLPQKYLAMY